MIGSGRKGGCDPPWATSGEADISLYRTIVSAIASTNIVGQNTNGLQFRILGEKSHSA